MTLKPGAVSDLAHGHTIGWGQSLGPEFLIPSPLCFIGPNRGHLLDSALHCSRPSQLRGVQQKGLGPVPGLSVLLRLVAALAIVCPAFPVTSPAPGLESCPLGTRAVRGGRG